MSRNEKVLSGVYLPADFHTRWKSFVKKMDDANPVRKVTEKELIYEALNEKMKKHTKEK